MKQVQNKIYKTGFTLIELLVVISIISLLSSVVLASVQEARENAFISSRVQTMREIRTALESYISAFGEYPGEESNVYVNSSSADYKNTLQPLIDEGYISSLPEFTDPPHFYYRVDDVNNNQRCSDETYEDSRYILYLGSVSSDQLSDYPELVLKVRGSDMKMSGDYCLPSLN